MPRTRRLTLAVAALLAVTLPLAVGSLALSDPPPPCLGAASRDADRPCDNPDLHLSVKPSPRDAQLQPSLWCVLIRTKPPSVCTFGTKRRRAVATVALVGDSHAPAWRAAVDVLARRQRWRGVSLARSSCPFANAARRYVPQHTADRCAEWLGGVIGWIKRHPEIRTVFVVNSAAYDFLPADGRDAHATAVESYRRALDTLPPSVRNIVVIRDNPKGSDAALRCVERAIAARERADQACALPREGSLLPDAATEAAGQLASGRGRSIDLSRFFCDEQHCYPVVGGVLVLKDPSHITRLFSRTLGPYLAAAYAALGLPAR